MKVKIRILAVILCPLLFMGCVNIQYTQEAKPLAPAAVYRRGIYHTVKAGQTLWRISRIYNIDLEELVNMNKISDVTSIEIGQQIFIPEDYKMSSSQKGESIEDFVWPIKGRVIARFQEIYQNMVNKGINIKPGTNRDVVASRSGKVVFCRSDFRGFGKTVIIEHAGGFMTVYAGLQEVFIRTGERVSRGSIIAKLGSSKEDKNNYLHFEIRKGHLPQNPIFYLPS